MRFDAFNRHDLVMECFHEEPVLVDAEGRRLEGREAVRRSYETPFALLPDGCCGLRSLVGYGGRGMAESLSLWRALGAEIVEFSNGKIKEIRDYHRRAGED